MKNRIVIMLTLVMVFAMGLLIQIARMDWVNRFWHNSGFDALNATLSVVNVPGKDAAEIENLKNTAEKYLVLYDSRQTGFYGSLKLAKNIGKVLDYMKKPNTLCDVYAFRESYANYDSVVITFENLANCPNLGGLIQFVGQGGGVFIARCPLGNAALSQISGKLGIVGLSNRNEGKGIKILTNILLQGRGKIVDQDFLYNAFLTVRLSKKCTIHATALNDNPLLWDIDCGKGKFVVFNGTMLDIKTNRGIITGALSLLHADYLYPILNLKVCYIDDFPAPIPQQYIKNVSKGYGRSFAGFYREVWWPDILKTMRRYHIIYNGMVIETYEARRKPPFNNIYSTGTTTLRTYGRELLVNGGEIGIHGYNHQPLAPKGYIKYEVDYRPWESQANMSLSIKETERYFQSVFPNYKLVSYVPPSNILSPMGRKALQVAMPDLKIIASLYVLNNNFPFDCYDQEYEIKDDGIIELPRMTYGYENTEEINWGMINGVSSIGVFSHFIHPDDVSDPYRNNGKDWDRLYQEYDSLQRDVYEKYPWLRSMKVSDAGLSLKKYLNTEISVKRAADHLEVRCNRLSGPIYFILRTAKKAKVPDGCSVRRIDHGVYLLGIDKPNCLIKLSR
jgi:hypothetical protein